MNQEIFIHIDPPDEQPWTHSGSFPSPPREDDTWLCLADLLRASLVERASRRICGEFGFRVPVFYSRACDRRTIRWDEEEDPSQDDEFRERRVLRVVSKALKCHVNEEGQAETIGVPVAANDRSETLHVATLSNDDGNTAVLVMLSTETVRDINTAGRSYCARHPRKGGSHV